MDITFRYIYIWIGERYGDGKKARNFYENACNLYEKAHNKEKQDFTCLYNW